MPTFSRRSSAHFAPTRKRASPTAVRRDDGSWLIAGSMPVDEMAEQLSMAVSAGADPITPLRASCSSGLGHLPAVGESFDCARLALRGRRPRRPPHRSHPGNTHGSVAPPRGGVERGGSGDCRLTRRPRRGRLNAIPDRRACGWIDPVISCRVSRATIAHAITRFVQQLGPARRDSSHQTDGSFGDCQAGWHALK